MNKKAIKKIIAFVKMLKAPSKMLPYIMGLVIAVIRRITDEDTAALIDLKEQGFICRRSEQIQGGCGSPAAAVCSNGSLAVAFACERIADDAVTSSVCLLRSSDSKSIALAGKRFIIDTPLQLGNVTLTQTPQGLMLGWRTRNNAYLHFPHKPNDLEKRIYKSFRDNNAANAMLIPEEERYGGMYYALIPENGDIITDIKPAPAFFSQGALTLAGGETLWLGIKDGKALAFRTLNVCKGFELVGTVPDIESGRTYSHVVAARLKNGRILAVLCSSGEFFASFSDDMGVRWTCPKPLEIKGTAPNLCTRDDGVVALSFVEPDKKAAVRSCINKDGESEWCKVRTLVTSTGDNIRHPSTVGISDTFFTVSRMRFCGDKDSSIVYTSWKPLKEDYDPVAEAQAAREEKKKSKGKKKKAV